MSYLKPITTQVVTRSNSSVTVKEFKAPLLKLTTDDQFKLILQKLKMLKSIQASSDGTLKGTSIRSLNDKVSQHKKTMSSLNQAVNTLNRNINIVANDVKMHGN